MAEIKNELVCLKVEEFERLLKAEGDMKVFKHEVLHLNLKIECLMKDKEILQKALEHIIDNS